MANANIPGRWHRLELAGGWRACVRAEVRIGDAALPGLPAWRAFLEQLVTQPAPLPGYVVLKSTLGSEVFRATLRDADREVQVVAKQSRRKNLRRRLSAWTRGSREARNLRTGIQLRTAGLNTAEPLVLLERKEPKPESWLVTEFVSGAVDLGRLACERLEVLDPQSRHAIKCALIAAIARLLDALDRAGLTHRDFKASNLLVRNGHAPSEKVSICMVDLDGVHRTALRTNRRRWWPVVRLAASLIGCPGVTLTDLIRLIRGRLVDAGRDAAEWRPLFRRIAAEAVAYERRSRRRRARKRAMHRTDQPASRYP